MRVPRTLGMKGWLLALALALFAFQPAGAIEFPTTPVTNTGGAKWRIGYYEGGSYGNYYEYLRSVASGLMDLGWIEPQIIPVHEDRDTRALWYWLAGNVRSEYVVFVESAFFTTNWDNGVRKQVRANIINRLNKRDDIDLMLALGTWAGKDLSTDAHHTPTLVMSASDPVGTGIVVSVKDSGRDHIFARVDPSRYERQIRMFHDVIGFRRLGVAYENSSDGRRYAALDTVNRIGRERGFQVVSCFTKSDIADQTAAGESVIECFRRLASEVDAIYVTLQGGVNEASLPELVEIANERRIPTFSQAGSSEVRSGFLLSISKPSFKPVGLFLAATAAQVFNGAKPRDLNQLYADTPNIAINLKTAELIGLYLYADVLAAADEIFRDISQP